MSVVVPGGALEVLYEPSPPSSSELPPSLVETYGGALGFDGPVVIANFVSSVDGVVALAESSESGHIISRGSAADRFVMGMLRVAADALVVGAGTFRKARGHLFRAEGIYPEAAPLFAEARVRLGLSPQPRLVVVTRSGAIDGAGPALEDALVVTTRSGEAALRGRLSKSTRVVALGAEAVRVTDVLALLRREGARVVLTEGGPTLFSEMLAARVVDELFLTTSPSLFGRYSGDHRKNLADGADLGGAPAELVSLRRHGSYLFSRYRLNASGSPDRALPGSGLRADSG